LENNVAKKMTEEKPQREPEKDQEARREGEASRALGSNLPTRVRPPDPLAVERNLGKFTSFIFAPGRHGKGKELLVEKPRTKTWKTTDPITGAINISRLSVLPMNNQTLNTEDCKNCLVGTKLYHEKLRGPEGETEYSLQEIARERGIAWAGKKTAKQIKDSLRRLRFTPIVWKYSFRDAKTGKLVSIEDGFTVFDRLRIVEKEGEEHTASNTPKAIFRFHPAIAENLALNHTKPFLFETVMSIHGEIALGLYAFLDVAMNAVSYREWRTLELFREILPIRGTYAKRSDRKRLLLRATEELEAKAISTGFLHLQIRETADKDDYKLCVRKTALSRPVDASASPRNAANAAGKGKVATSTWVARRRPGPHTGNPYNLTNEEVVKAEGMALMVVDAIGHQKNRRFFFTRAAESIINRCTGAFFQAVSETKLAVHDGRIDTTPSQFFNDQFKRLSSQLDLLPLSSQPAPAVPVPQEPPRSVPARIPQQQNTEPSGPPKNIKEILRAAIEAEGFTIPPKVLSLDPIAIGKWWEAQKARRDLSPNGDPTTQPNHPDQEGTPTPASVGRR
jgi:hypothetical protein